MTWKGQGIKWGCCIQSRVTEGLKDKLRIWTPCCIRGGVSNFRTGGMFGWEVLHCEGSLVSCRMVAAFHHCVPHFWWSKLSADIAGQEQERGVTAYWEPIESYEVHSKWVKRQSCGLPRKQCFISIGTSGREEHLGGIVICWAKTLRRGWKVSIGKYPRVWSRWMRVDL